MTASMLFRLILGVVLIMVGAMGKNFRVMALYGPSGPAPLKTFRPPSPDGRVWRCSSPWV